MLKQLILCSVATALALDGFPSTWTVFSSTFAQPEPPQIQGEYRANWMQHKWNANVSHIASGFIYNSPSNRKVRTDEIYDGALGSSLFDYTNVTEAGVANRQWLLSPAVSSPPTCFVGFVTPAFPLISTDLLVSSGAVFGGVVEDNWAGNVATWHILFQGTIPTKVLLDGQGVVQGYDFWGLDQRTYVVTRFFNIIMGTINKEVFDFPCA